MGQNKKAGIKVNKDQSRHSSSQNTKINAKRKNTKKSKNNKRKKVVIVLALVFVIILGILTGFIWNKLSKVNFLELDTLLYNINDNITIINNTGTTITTTAKYYSSGSSSPSLAFGNCGYVSWNNDNNNYYTYDISNFVKNTP